MKELNPALKPPRLEAESNSIEVRQPAQSLPGFWARAGAFALDAGLLTLFDYLLARQAYAWLYPMRWGAQVLAFLLVYVYFWIGSSRLMNGQTVGKHILELRTVGLDGQPLGWGAAARRAVGVFLIVGAYAVGLGWSTGRDFVHFSEYGKGTFLVTVGFGMVTMAYALANAVFCALHPHKRSLHDLASGALVVRAGEVERGVAFVAEREEWHATRVKLAIYPAVTLALLVGFLLGSQAWEAWPKLDALFAPMPRVREALTVAGLRPLQILGPSREDHERFRAYLKEGEARRQERLAAGDLEGARRFERPTSATLELYPDGTCFVFSLVAETAFATTESLVTSPAYLDVKRRAPGLARELSAEFFRSPDGLPNPYNRILVQVYEVLPLFLYTENRLRWREVVPVGEATSATVTGGAN
ncbi:MAG TPA: RDD family protein [Candidatus Sumerlaeota bacterium]|nr:RDD family protein [Candidatus Sumerlaeota bacterium]HPS01716.1 RDD family protein [Candidatus Sumerlaeota bacterium]